MKRLFAVFAVLVAAAVIITACGGGGGGGGGGTRTTTVASTPTTNTAATAAQASAIASNSGVTLSNFASTTSTIRAPKFMNPAAKKDARFAKVHAAQTASLKGAKAKMTAAVQKAKQLVSVNRVTVPISSTTIACADGGTSTMSGSFDDVSLSFTINMSFTDCREFDTETNGSMSATGTFSTTGDDTFTVTVGNGNNVIDTTGDFSSMLFSPGYVDVYASYVADMTIAGSGACGGTNCSTYTSTMTANGKENYDDFIDVYSLTYNALKFVGTDTTTAGGYSGSFQVSGGFSESWNSGAEAVAITFGTAGTPVTMAWTETGTYYEESIDGTIVTNFTPDTLCHEGTFVIDTTTPVRYDYASGETVAGRVVINTTLIIVFNADGTVTVTDTSGSNSYASIDALEGTCPIQDFEDSSTESTDTTTGGTYNATGSTLLATLSWTGGDSSDMDLHLEHYTTTAPNASSVNDWHVYFGNMSSLNNEAVLDIDDTQGFGPEHITMATLPTGYYVLYVDPYSLDLDPSATITVTLKIGTSSFQFPTKTFTSSSEPVHRVCDIKVEAGGAVTVLPPNTALSTDYAAPSMRAPKNR